MRGFHHRLTTFIRAGNTAGLREIQKRPNRVQNKSCRDPTPLPLDPN